MAKWLRQWHLRDMKSTGHDLDVMGLNPGWVELAKKSLMAEWLKRQHLGDMKCTVHDLEVMGLNHS